MARSYDEFYKRKRNYLSELVDDPESAVTADEEEHILELCDAFDEDRPTVSIPHWPDAGAHLTKPRSDGTLANWCYHLTSYAREVDLLDTSARELNQVAEDWLHGDSDIKDSSVSKGTIRVNQNTARIFYRYHDHLGVDRERIAVFERQESGINPRDMLTPDEIARIREVPDNPRDQAILDLLLYTGVRNRALRTLRVKDINLEDAEYYFNTNADNLKNIYKPQAPRPLLGAVASVRDWLDYHPYSDDPKSYLITAKPKWNTVDPHETVGDSTIQRVTRSIKKEAGVDKPMHPHAMRHNFVTLCKREYDLDDATVKFLIGHAPDSTIMETTYSHLSGEDHMEKARVGAGIESEDEQSSLTPDFCNSCGEPLGPDAKACSNCGTVYTPDARSTEQGIEDALFEDKGEAEGELEMDLDDLREAIHANPELKALLLDNPE